MWKLTPPDEKFCKWFVGEILPDLKKKILNSTVLTDDIKRLLIPNLVEDIVLTQLLIDPPNQSLSLSVDLMKKINEIVVKTPIITFTQIKEELKKVFDYDGFIVRKKERAYKISYTQGSNTCTYCNRLYNFTIIADTPNGQRRIARPQLDHWLDKASHPLLSLNIYNLIPSCPICNSSVKGSHSFTLATHIHPYLNTEHEPKFKFKLSLDKNKNPRIPFLIEIDDSQCSTQEKNMIRDFALNEIYAYHGEHEGKDLYLWRLENDTLYLHNLFNKIGGKFKRSTEEIFRMFFGTEYLSDNNLNRPLSKLKRDLLYQLGLLDATGKFIP